MKKIIKRENNLFVILFIGLIATFAVLTFALVNMTEDERMWTDHRRSMEFELEGILSSVFEMEALQRGYLVAQRPERTETYKEAEKKAFMHLANAQPLTSDVEIQKIRLKKLEGLLRHRKVLLDSVIYLSNKDSIINLGQIVPLIVWGDSVMKDFKKLVGVMATEEENLLEERLRQIKSYSLGSILAAAFLGLTTIAITVYLYVKLYRGAKEKIAARTLQEKTVEILKQNELRYRNLNNTSNDGIVIADGEGKIISWNISAKNIFGYEEGEIMNQPIVKIIPEHYREKHTRGFESFLKTGKSELMGKRIELTGMHKSGKEIPIEITLSHWTIDGQRFFSATIRDNTQTKEAQEKLNMALAELQRSNEDLEHFAYVASHDLQEPLRKIRAFGDRLVQKGKELDWEGNEYVVRMVDGAERMQTLITDLLSFSRLVKGDENFEKVDLNETLKSVIDTMQVSIEETNATINVEKLPILSSASRSQMEQLFQNLIANAIKFKKPDRSPIVTISAEVLKREDFDFQDNVHNPLKLYYKITVSDNGIGFDIKYLDKIFTIFQRLHGRNEYKGTGIGLAICKKICENHNGFITAQPHENGADFIVILPK